MVRIRMSNLLFAIANVFDVRLEKITRVMNAGSGKDTLRRTARPVLIGGT